MPALARHAARVLRNAFLSPGARLFGPRFSADYLRFALESARRWGDTGPGTLRLLGARVDYFNRTNALFLVHELFANAEYAFRAETPTPRIVDCGANIGLSVLFFKRLHPGARIVAFEPEPTTFARLERTVAENGLQGVVLHHAAVAEAAGTVTLYADPADPGGITSSTDPAWGGPVAREVPAVRLSEVLREPVDFLKLDVEGAEYGVVRDLAASGALALVREAVIEYHDVASEPDGPARLAEILRTAGMEVTTHPLHPANRLGLLRARRRPS